MNSEIIQEFKKLNPKMGYKAIAKHFGLSPNTVKYHLKKGEKKKTVKRILRWRQTITHETKLSLGGKCCVCDYERDLTALDFHHTDPSIKDRDCDGVTRILNQKGCAAFLKEIETCILVCANCHREIHSGSIVCELLP